MPPTTPAVVANNQDFGGPSDAQAAAGNAALGLKPIVPTYQTPKDPNIPGTATYDPYGGTAAAGHGLVDTPKEPTVLSSSNITDHVIPSLNQRAATVATKGTYVGQDSKTYYSDGSLVPAPLDAQFDESTNTYKDGNGAVYGAPPQFVDNPTNDPELQKTNDLLTSLKNSLDSSTLGQVNAIHQQFESLRQSQAEANAGQDMAEAAMNARTGTSRYAPLNAMSLAIATTNNGLARIQKLDADENAAIAQVKTAQNNGNYQIMSKALDTVDKIRADKATAAKAVQDALSKANDAAATQKEQVQRDNAIGSVLSQGITDPKAILKALNDAGYSVTADQVNASIKNLTPTAAAGSTYKFTNTDVGKLLGVGLTPAQVQSVQDYYNGKGSADTLTNLTAAQKAAVQTVLVGKTAAATGGAKPKVSGTLNYTQADLADGNAKLQASKGADGYVDPNLYLNLAQAWTGHGGSIKDFIKEYPVSSWVNPANTFVSPAINALIKQDAAGTKTTGAATSDITTEINQLFSQNPS